MPRHARKRDANEAQIVKALRAAGATVTHLDGAGVPDLLVGFRGRTLLLEVKDPSTLAGKAHKRHAGELTEAQAKWHGEWCGAPAVIVHDETDALRVILAAHLIDAARTYPEAT